MMNNLEQLLQALQLRLHQEEELEDLLVTLREIEDLTTQYPVKETYALLAHAYRALREATSDDPDAARDLLLHRFLPWLIASDLPGSADRARGDGSEILRQWLDQYPEDVRENLLHSILDILLPALRTQPTRPLCWTIGELGYRRPDVVTHLWEVIHHDAGALGDAALYTLAELQLQGADRQLLLEELHRRMVQSVNHSLFGALGKLADVSTIPIMQQCLDQLSQNKIVSLTQPLALRVLTDIADAHDSDDVVQETIWKIIAARYESAPEQYTSAIYLGGEIASRCNDPDVPQRLMQWLEHHSDDSERAIHHRYLLYVRLSECIRPRQLMWEKSGTLSSAPMLLQGDTKRNSGLTGQWATLESHVKEQAWDALLYLGDAVALSPDVFDKAVVEETSGYLQGWIMELLACFRWTSLPNQVLSWITERRDVKQEVAHQEIPLHRGAEHLARGSATREAFEALLAFGWTFEGEVLRETPEALASVALTLMQQGEAGIIEALLTTIESGKEECHRTAAMLALATIADKGLLPPSVLPRIVGVLQDKQRSDFERSRLVHLLGAVPPGDITPELMDLLQHMASADQTEASTRAIEALAYNGGLIDMPDFLEKRLGLHAKGEQWNYPDAATANSWITGIIGVLYSHAPHRFAPAVAALLKHTRLFELVTLLASLDEVHRVKHQSVPHEIHTALFTRLARLQDAMLTTPTQLLQTCAHLIPDTLAQQVWEREWERWTPETRVALAEALGQGMYTSETTQKQAENHLLQLLCDAQYQVRRAAICSLTTLAPEVLFQICTAWTYAPLMELRRRAAEVLSWVPTGWEVRPLLHQRLAVDPDPLVRETLARTTIERRQRTWASDYLARCRDAYGKGNQMQLAVWRYGYALTQTGDEMTLAALQSDLTTLQLAPHERQWLRWMFNKMQEHWKKAMDQWPKPWFTWIGEVISLPAHMAFASHLTLHGICSLYKQESVSQMSRQACWGGAIWLERPAVIPEQTALVLRLTDGRQGKASVVTCISDKIWIVEGMSDLA